MAYREFRDELIYKSPDQQVDFTWMKDAIADQDRLAALRDKKKQEDNKIVDAFKESSPYPEDAKAIGSESLEVIKKTQLTGASSPEDKIKLAELSNRSNITKAQKQREVEVQQQISAADDYTDKEALQGELQKTYAKGVNYSNRDQIFDSINPADPKYFKIEKSDIDFLSKYKDNSSSQTFKNENSSFVTDSSTRSINKPFTYEDKTKQIGTDPITKKPIYEVVAGVTDDHVAAYLDKNDAVGSRRVAKINAAISDEDVTKRILEKNGDPTNPVAVSMAREALVEEVAKKRLEKYNVGKDEFKKEKTREKPAADSNSGSGSGSGDKKNWPIRNQNSIVKTGAWPRFEKTNSKGEKSWVFKKSEDSKEERTENKISEQFVADQYVLGRDAQNMTPTVRLRSAKIYSIDDNIEIAKNTGEFQDIELASLDLLPVNKKTGKVQVSSKGVIDKDIKEGSDIEFKWYATGTLEEQNGTKTKKKGVIIPLDHGDAKQMVGGVIEKQNGGFNLDKRTPDQLSPYEKYKAPVKEKAAVVKRQDTALDKAQKEAGVGSDPTKWTKEQKAKVSELFKLYNK